MGIFQYFLLYACPKPGRQVENKAAFFGECIFVFGWEIPFSKGLLFIRVSWDESVPNPNKQNTISMNILLKHMEQDNKINFESLNIQQYFD